MNRQLLALLVFLLTCLQIDAQVLQSATFLEHRTKDQISQQFGLPFFKNGVKLYKLTYLTPDVNGAPSIASGLLAVPDNFYKRYPLLCYQHGTVSSRDAVPSRLSPEANLVVYFSALGYLGAAPDYLGLGDSPGFHPYVHAETEASAAVDMMRAAREFASQLGLALNEQVFVTGYSQGGHAAMALHRKLETELSDEFKVAASAPMSGPYSISGVMRNLVLSESEYYYPAYIPNMALGYQTAYGNLYTDLEEIFKPAYVGPILQYYNEVIDLGELNQQLIQLLIQQEGASKPVKMIQPDYLAAITSDPTHPLNLALKDNDTYEWAPQAPTRLVYCQNDDQVPYLNTIIADSVMHALGAPDVLAYDPMPAANHAACVTPAVFFTGLFFSTIQELEDLTTATRETGLLSLAVWPNPADSRVQVSLPDGVATLSIVDGWGRVLRTEEISGPDYLLDTSYLPKGLYVLQVRSAKGLGQTRLVISH